MKTKLSDKVYLEYAGSFLDQLKQTIEHSLVRDAKKLKKRDREELVESLVWNLATLLDGSANLGHKGKTLVPFLGFQLDGKKEVVFDAGGIVFHELIDFDDSTDEDVAEKVIDSEPPKAATNASYVPLLGDGRTYESEVKFASGIAVGYSHVGWEEDKDALESFARQFFRVFYPNEDRKRIDVRISSISPLMAKITEVKIATGKGWKRLEGAGLADFTISKLYRKIADQVQPG